MDLPREILAKQMKVRADIDQEWEYVAELLTERQGKFEGTRLADLHNRAAKVGTDSEALIFLRSLSGSRAKLTCLCLALAIKEAMCRATQRALEREGKP